MIAQLSNLCAPAFIYFVFSVVNVIMEVTHGMINAAVVRTVVSIVITLLLNTLCANNMSIVSWIIVFIPFIMMTYVIGILLLALGMNPTTGKLPPLPPGPDSRDEAAADAAQADNGDILPYDGDEDDTCKSKPSSVDCDGSKKESCNCPHTPDQNA